MTTSHILYADDTLILFEAEKEHLVYLREVLLYFEAVTGLKIDLAESSTFSINVDECIEELVDILGCKVEKLPTAYRGLPPRERRNDHEVRQGY